jgi:predicted amidohydrolase
MVQMTSRIGDLDGNLRKMLEFTDDSKGSDLICFPEMSLTGYGTSLPDDCFIDASDKHVRDLVCSASKAGIAIVFGFARRNDGRKHVSHAFACPDGPLAVYDKTHLGVSERHAYDSGDLFLVASAGRAKVGVELCSESHFPEISTCLRSMGADLILAPHASSIEAKRRVELWKKYLPARAYDNGVFVAACNRLPEGGILILDRKGEVVAEDVSVVEGAVTVDIDVLSPRVPPERRVTMAETDYFSLRRPELYGDVARRRET